MALLAVVALGAPLDAASQEASESCVSPDCCQGAEGAELHGEVLVAESGAPIPGATVEFQVTAPPEHGRRSTHEIQTGDSGTYRLCGISTPAAVEAQAERSGATSRSVSFRLDNSGRVELSFEIQGVLPGLDSLEKAAAASRAESGPGRITGRIEDASTGMPVAEATVILTPGDRRALTDGQGRFAIEEARSGEGKLAIHHVAYGDQTVDVDVPAGLTVNLDIELPPKAIEVAPIDVRVEATIRSRHLERRGFYDRMEKDFGHHWSPEELERRSPLRVSHVLQQTPGVRIAEDCSGMKPGLVTPYCRKIPVMAGSVPTGSGGFSRTQTQNGNWVTTDNRGLKGCPATVYLDGRKIQLGDMGIDELVPISSIAAVEVYRGASATPPEFISSDSRCGVVVLWTRRGPAMESGGGR